MIKKSKNEMLEQLSKNLPAEIIEESEHVQNNEMLLQLNQKIVKDSEEDYQYTRDRIKKLLDTSDEAIACMLNLATDSEHPRAFEVLSGMIKNAADINNQLMVLVKQRKSVVDSTNSNKKVDESKTNITNNSIFVGTTTELQKLIKANQVSKPIDV